MPLQQRNPTHGKTAIQLAQAGASPYGAILAGLRGRFRFEVEIGETVQNHWFASDAGDALPINVFWDSETDTLAADVIFGRDTFYGRNILEWVTNRGLTNRQFYVAPLPEFGALYLDGQEAQGVNSRAVVFIDEGTSHPMARCASIGVNILPNFSDEFFRQHEYNLNRYANTRRDWGGAATAEIFVDEAVVVPEQDIANVCNLWLENLTWGQHDVVVRLRAAEGSGTYVDIEGRFWARQMPV